MGGGTGTGAAPIIAKTAKEMDILTVGIVTLPFTFEGRRRTSQGSEGLEELKKNVDTLIVISNDKLRQIHGNLSISDAFAEADDILTTAAKGIAEIITVPGYVNVDFEDVNTVMRESGVAIMGTASAEGEDRAKRAVDDALHSPLLEDNDIRGAQHILLNITSGTKEVTMDEIFEITEFVQEEAGYGTDLIWGNCYDEELGEKISVTVIATGFEHNKQKKANKVADDKVIVALDEDQPKPPVEDQPKKKGPGRYWV
jgi:cell division protein FtsZ